MYFRPASAGTASGCDSLKELDVRRNGFAGIALGCWLVSQTAVAHAQELNLPGLTKPAVAVRSADKEPVTVRLAADVRSVKAGTPFTIAVLIDVAPKYHTYYRTAGTIGLGTRVSFKGPDGWAIGPVEFPPPEVHESVVGEQVEIQYSYSRDTAVWAIVTPPADAMPGTKAEFSATVRVQACTDSNCLPPKKSNLSLALPVDTVSGPSDEASRIAKATRQRPLSGSETKHVAVSAAISQDKVRPGDTFELAIVADVDPNYHLQTNKPTIEGLIPTEVVLEPGEGLITKGPPRYPAGVPPTHPLEGFEQVRELRGKVVIRVPLAVEKDTNATTLPIEGLFRFQTCKDGGSCLPTQTTRFQVTVPIVPVGSTVQNINANLFSDNNVETAPVPEATNTAPAAADLSYLDHLQLNDESSGGSFGWYLFSAFFGGLILNFMPCVLPVIAIKAMSFVHQAGSHRGRILLLNVAYAVGVIGVFLILASLAVFAQIGWGGLFQKTGFNLFMIGLVFAMGLSLLGVYELPVPGLSMGRQEGLAGAFATGVFATFLATPCSGPLLGPLLAWSVTQPSHITYLFWAVMGLGMSFPYLMFGLFPSSIRLLPRPGEWMHTFKQGAGLILMGTVVFILSYIEETYLIPALVMLLGLAIGLWIVGAFTSVLTPRDDAAMVYSIAAVVAVAIGWFGLTKIHDIMVDRVASERLRMQNEVLASVGTKRPDTAAFIDSNAEMIETNILPWEPFSDERLRELLADQRTVLIDFSAKWCLTCKLNEGLALNTEEVKALVNEGNIATLYADYTHESPEITAWLQRFKSISVPLTVIFPAKSPDRPTVLRDAFTQATLLEALKAAGPSQGNASLTEAKGTAALEPSSTRRSTPQ